MVAIWEIPKDQREGWDGLNKADEKLTGKIQESYEDGRRAMTSLFSASVADLSQRPSGEIVGWIRTIGESQSAFHFVPYINDLLRFGFINQETVGLLLEALRENISRKHNRVPLNRRLKELFVEIERRITELDPLKGDSITPAFLGLVEELVVNDSEQTTIGFINSPGHQRLGQEQIDKIKAAIQKRNTGQIFGELIGFWQVDGEFAVDDEIKKAYRLWQNMEEEYSDKARSTLPAWFNQTAESFNHILSSDSIRWIDRQRIAQFLYETSKKCVDKVI